MAAGDRKAPGSPSSISANISKLDFKGYLLLSSDGLMKNPLSSGKDQEDICSWRVQN